MKTIDIPRQAWTSTLDAFSATHEGWLISVDVLDSAIGAQPEVDNLPLIGVSADRGGAIAIAAGGPSTGHITHTIQAASHLRLERGDDGADIALQIGSPDGSETILRFRVAALPETVDGIARG